MDKQKAKDIEKMNDGLDTFPKLFLHHATTRPQAIAYRVKEFGIWQSYNWAHSWAEVQKIAYGLRALGFGKHNRLLIVGENRPFFYWSMCAAQALGGTPVPAYQDGLPEDYAFLLKDAEASFALAENQEYVDKLLEAKAEGGNDSNQQEPILKHIIYEDPRGLRDYEDEGLISFEALLALGEAQQAKEPEFLINQIKQTKGSDVAIIPYTSGTTGRPKGVVLSFDNVLISSRMANEFDHLTQDEDILSYLPMAWIGDHIFSYGQALTAGFTVNCPENQETVLICLRDIGPTYYFAPPRVFENLITNVTIRMEDASPVKRKLYKFFMKHATKIGVDLLDGKKDIGLLDRFIYGLGNLIIYAPLKDSLGLSRVRLAYTAGEAIGPEIFKFYRSIGVNLKQLYGQTEAAVFIAMQPDGEIFSDTVGPPAPWVEIKIDDRGEVLYRSIGVFQEYLKNPTSTQETKDDEGWVKSGDAGYILPNGHLRIIDRAKDVGKLNQGSLFAPKYLENKLKFFPQIREAVIFGDKKDFVTALINIDLQAMGNWAERNAIAFASYQELAANPSVQQEILTLINQVNQDLASDPKMNGSQIKRFLILPKELDADDGELTRTRKVRRNIIDERYASLIKALYDGSASVHLSLKVTFEDGRTGNINGDITIQAAEIYKASAELNSPNAKQAA